MESLAEAVMNFRYATAAARPPCDHDRAVMSMVGKLKSELTRYRGACRWESSGAERGEARCCVLALEKHERRRSGREVLATERHMIVEG